jgi:cell volume regulation protein A
MDVLLVFVIISAILFFGFFAEYVFRKTGIPDVLFLLLFGIILGKYGLDMIHTSDVAIAAPIFISFALMFLLYDGAFRIDLASFAKGFSKSMQLTWFNFFVSAAVITGIFLACGFDIYASLLVGFTLGGISSAFVIPVLKQMDVSKPVYSILALESAFTDVICIVFALTVMDLMTAATISLKTVASTIVSLFAVAGMIGVVGGIIWAIVLTKLLKEELMNMVTIAFLLVIYVATEYLGGNGAIACLFFGIVLKNSFELRALLHQAMYPEAKPEKPVEKTQNQEVGISLTTVNEEEFYREIAFFVKTLFFVYIGILLDFSDQRAVIIGVAAALVILAVRPLSKFVTRDMKENDAGLIGAVFARGIAPAAIMQLAVTRGIPGATELSGIVMIFILATIVLSSGRIFLFRYRHRAPRKA